MVQWLGKRANELPAEVAAPIPETPTVTGAPQTLPEGSPPESSTTDDTPAWRRAATREEALAALLDDEDLPLDAVTKHQRVSGVIGTHAKRQAQVLREQEANAAREQRRRDLAASGRTVELGQDVAGDYVADPATEAERAVTQRLTGSAQGELAKLLEELPKEAQQRLSERATDGAYSGTFGEGLRTWVNDLASERVAAELPKALDKEIKRRDLIPRAVAEAERVSGLGSPDVRRGGSAGAPDWETELEMATELAPLLAVKDPEAIRQMTQWHRRHGR